MEGAAELREGEASAGAPRKVEGAAELKRKAEAAIWLVTIESGRAAGAVAKADEADRRATAAAEAAGLAAKRADPACPAGEQAVADYMAVLNAEQAAAEAATVAARAAGAAKQAIEVAAKQANFACLVAKRAAGAAGRKAAMRAEGEVVEHHEVCFGEHRQEVAMRRAEEAMRVEETELRKKMAWWDGRVKMWNRPQVWGY